MFREIVNASLEKREKFLLFKETKKKLNFCKFKKNFFQ